ncbi:hypothetical protein IP88_14835 [alpha proteobacterium AAP81b]|nr:hypothetical protein IP88_14835 [alpha proteobacterium AAP81b]
MRFLIDECLSPSLVGLAHQNGHDASHVGHLGLGRTPDHLLMPVIIGGDYSFVTNNRRDFLRLYRSVNLHAGLLIILPAAVRAEQLTLFGRAIDAIAAHGGDLTCELLEVDATGAVSISPFPPMPQP